MTSAGAIAAAESRDALERVQPVECVRPGMLESHGLIAAPGTRWRCHRAQIVDVPVALGDRAQVPTETRANAAGPQGAAHIEVVRGLHGQRSPATDPYLGAPTTFEQQRVGTGSRSHELTPLAGAAVTLLAALSDRHSLLGMP